MSILVKLLSSNLVTSHVIQITSPIVHLTLLTLRYVIHGIRVGSILENSRVSYLDFILLLESFSENLTVTRTAERTNHALDHIPSHARCRSCDPHSMVVKNKSGQGLPDACLALYNRAKSLVLDRHYPRTVKEATATLNVSERTWRRKQKIAELMILDRSRFNEIVARLLRDTGSSSLNQATLSDRCAMELKKPQMMQKRREAILSGELI